MLTIEPTKPGNQNMEDFKELHDRLIAEGLQQPTLVIKTNLDPENVTENNPYYRNKKLSDTKEFTEYFDE